MRCIELGILFLMNMLFRCGKHLLAVIALSIVITLPVQACPENKITVAGGHFPPYSYIDRYSKKCIGSLVKELEQLIDTLGYHVDSFCAPSARIYQMIDNGQVDLTINTKTTKLLKGNVTFLPLKMTNFSLSLYQSIEADDVKVIAGVRGYSYGGKRQEFIDDGFVFIDFPDTESSTRFFLTGRAKYLMAYDEPFNFYVNSREMLPKIAYRKSLLSSEGAYIAVSTKSDLHDALVTQFSSLAETKLKN